MEFCRCCLQSEIELSSVYEAYYEDIRMDLIIKSVVSQIKIKENDVFFICHKCQDNAVSAFDFIQMCIASDQNLLNTSMQDSQMDQEEQDTFLDEEDPLENCFSDPYIEEIPDDSNSREYLDDPNDIIEEDLLVEDFTYENRHSATRKKQQAKACSECGLVCEDAVELINHLHTHKMNLDDSSDTPFKKFDKQLKHPPRPKKFGCPECNKLFESPSKVSRHMNIHTKERERLEKFGTEFMLKKKNRPRNYSCDFCHKKWESPSKVIRHISQVHMKQELKKEETDLFQGLVQNSENEFTITDSPPIPSTSNSFTEINITVQKKVKTKYVAPKKYRCETCEKMFETPSRLERHLMAHKKEEMRVLKFGPDYKKHIKKNYECTVCFKKWESPSKVRRHMMQVHEPKQPKIKSEQEILNELTTSLQSEEPENHAEEPENHAEEPENHAEEPEIPLEESEFSAEESELITEDIEIAPEEPAEIIIND